MFKDYCHTIGLCFFGVLIYTGILWFSLFLSKNYHHDIVIHQCSRFILVGSFVSIIIVSLFFLNRYRIQRKEQKRQLQHKKSSH